MEDDTNEALFDVLIKKAAEKALAREIDELPTCEEANSQFKPSAKFNKRVKALILRHSFKGGSSGRRRTSVRAAAVIVIFFAVSGSILLSVEATRNFIFNAVVKWENGFFSFQNEDGLDEGFVVLKPAYLPEGFEETSANFLNSVNRTNYENDAGLAILFRQSRSKLSNSLADYEGKNVADIKVNSHQGYLVEADEQNKQNSIIWEQDGFVFVITSKIEIEEMFLIAESVRP